MSTYSDLELRRVPLFIRRRRAEWEELLDKQGLHPSEPLVVAGLYDADDSLKGCASLCKCGNGLSIQCVAMDSSVEAHGQVGRMIDYLRTQAADACPDADGNLFLFTKPEYEKLFASLAFHTVGHAPKAVLLESNPRAVRRYTEYLGTFAKKGLNGVIVMNANPFTRGHLYLVEEAARRVDNLYIIPVMDDGEPADGHFPYSLRVRAIKRAIGNMDNVTLLEGSRYAISAATFPNYFIKTLTEVTDNQIALDLDIFASHIAPALGASFRFAGSEPTDALTARYNTLLHEILPKRGIEVVEIERTTVDGSNASEAISASSVRKNIKNGAWSVVSRLVPPTTLEILLGDLAVKALMTELETHPKPGLVTPHSNGAHADMDYSLMRHAIEALRPCFEHFAALGLYGASHDDIVAAGLKAETTMMQASNGVNTHRGAIFSLGLTVIAAASLLREGMTISPMLLQETISSLAAPFEAPSGTNGAKVRSKVPLRSLLDMAAQGYPELFRSWLPFFRSRTQSEMPLQATLLHIMQTLDDTNICHRGGTDALRYVKATAAATLETLTTEALERFAGEMTSRNLSPGGSADMLALTVLADALLPKANTIKQNIN